MFSRIAKRRFESMDKAPISWEIILQYFPDLTARQKQQYELLYEEYGEWNEKINVVSRKDFNLFYERHVLHSMAIAKIADLEDGTRILDVGTGGGFPGIPLAIFYPNCTFHLVDSIGKKIKVVKEVVAALGLENVTAEQARMEQVSGKYDLIVTRAVAPLAKLKHWLQGKIKKRSNQSVSGLICLKGGDLTEEIVESRLKVKLHNISDHFKEDFFETKKVLWIKTV